MLLISFGWFDVAAQGNLETLNFHSYVIQGLSGRNHK